MHGPAHFRNAINLCGFPAPSVVPPMASPDALYVCAAHSALPAVHEAYKRFSALSRKAGIICHPIETQIINNLPATLTTDAARQTVRNLLRTEATRLHSSELK